MFKEAGHSRGCMKLRETLLLEIQAAFFAHFTGVCLFHMNQIIASCFQNPQSWFTHVVACHTCARAQKGHCYNILYWSSAVPSLIAKTFSSNKLNFLHFLLKFSISDSNSWCYRYNTAQLWCLVCYWHLSCGFWLMQHPIARDLATWCTMTLELQKKWTLPSQQMSQQHFNPQWDNEDSKNSLWKLFNEYTCVYSNIRSLANWITAGSNKITIWRH